MLSGGAFAQIALAEQIAGTHHVRRDGKRIRPGSPAADRIVAVAVAVADVIDALTHARPYKSA